MWACSTGETEATHAESRDVYFILFEPIESVLVCVHNFVKQTRSEPRKLQPFHYLNRNSECVHTWQLEMCSWFPTALDTGYVGTRVSVHFFPSWADGRNNNSNDKIPVDMSVSWRVL